VSLAIQSIGVFCGVSSGEKESYSHKTRALASLFCGAGIRVIFGGASVGLMDVLAQEMVLHQGKIIGVMPEALLEIRTHLPLSSFHVVQSMGERKALVDSLSDAFLMLPGGVGSLDEYFDMLAMSQVGYHTKPCIIYNMDGYYNDLLRFLNFAKEQGFVSEATDNKIIVVEDLESLCDALGVTDHRHDKHECMER